MTPELAPPRPRGLTLALVLCIVVGWSGAFVGFREVSFYSSDLVDAPPLVANADAREQEIHAEYFRTRNRILDRARKTQLPLAVGNLLLSGLLAVSASRALSGRPGSRVLIQQALVANGLFTAVDYVLSHKLRTELVPAITSTTRSLVKVPPNLTEQQLSESLSALVWTVFRLQLFLTLLVYVVAFLSLRSRAALAFLPDADEAPGDDDD